LQYSRPTLALVDLDLRHTIPNANESSIDVCEARDYQILKSLLDLLLDKASYEMVKRLAQEVVLRTADGDLEGIDLHDNVLGLKYAQFFLVGRDNVESGLNNNNNQ
jgi:hypothetical protein